MNGSLFISNGTDTIYLNEPPFSITDWVPKAVPHEDTWQSTPYAFGRSLINRVPQNIIDVFTISMYDSSVDSLYEALQRLRNLLNQASDYWINHWENDNNFVYLGMQSPSETNIRYSIILSGSIPEEIFPFFFPFRQPSCRAVVNDVELGIEHGPWLSNIPGNVTATPIAGYGTFDNRLYGNVVANTVDYSCTSDAFSDNLLSSVTVDPTTGLKVNESINTGLIQETGMKFSGINIPRGATITAASVKITIINSGDTPFDIRAEYNPSPADFTTSYAAFVARRNNVTTSSVTWPPHPFWGAGSVRESPDISAVIQEVIDRSDWVSGDDIAVFFMDPASADPSGDEFLFAGNNDSTYPSREPLLTITYTSPTGESNIDYTTGDVYVTNYHTVGNVSHIFWDDGGVFGPNLVSAQTPYSLLPDIPVSGDIVYFGLDVTSFSGTPHIRNLVFDLTGGLHTSGVWEVYTGSWVPATVTVDNTSSLQNSGVNSIHWEVDTSQVAVSVNGVACVWLRYRVTAGSGSAGPIQLNRPVYSTTWPFVEIHSDNLPSDLHAFVSERVFGDHEDAPFAATDGNIFHFATRRLDRGSNYTPFINTGNTQNPSGITVAPGSASAFVDSVEVPSGRYTETTAVGLNFSTAAGFPHILIDFDSTITGEYIGEYQLIIRYDTDATTVGDDYYEARWELFDSGSNMVRHGDTIRLRGGTLDENTNLIEMMGRVSLPFSALASPFQLGLNFRRGAGAGNLVSVYDVILWPIDEIVVSSYPLNSGITGMSTDEYLRVGDARLLKNTDSDLYTISTGNRTQVWTTRRAKNIALRSRKSYRIWHMSYISGSNPVPVESGTHFNDGYRIFLDRTDSFYSGRGDK